LMPFSLPSPFSITRFNFFCLQVLLTRASLLALANLYIIRTLNVHSDKPWFDNIEEHSALHNRSLL